VSFLRSLENRFYGRLYRLLRRRISVEYLEVSGPGGGGA
jgi:hypothetical protein